MTTERKTKRTIYFTKSSGKIGEKEERTPSPWKPGKSKNKYKEK